MEEGKPCKRGLPLVGVLVMYGLPLSGNGSCSVQDVNGRTSVMDLYRLKISFTAHCDQTGTRGEPWRLRGRKENPSKS